MTWTVHFRGCSILSPGVFEWWAIECACAWVWLFSWSTCSIMYHSCQSHTGSRQSLRPRLQAPLSSGTSARKCATLVVSDAASSGTVPLYTCHSGTFRSLLWFNLALRTASEPVMAIQSRAAASQRQTNGKKKPSYFYSVHLGVAFNTAQIHRVIMWHFWI